MTRTNIIQAYIDKYNYKSFLEIGVDTGWNQYNIKCEKKVGVDPSAYNPKAVTHVMTSDEFFKQNKENFDIIFVDGLHYATQVYKDVLNSLKILNKGGTIICHDMSPVLELHQRVPRQSQIWNGDCWKAFVELRRDRSDLEMFTIDTDWGCGVIRKGNQPKLKLTEALTFDNLVINRKKWLNLLTTEEFLQRM